MGFWRMMGGEGVRGSGSAMAAVLLAAALTGCSSNLLDSAAPPSGGSSFRERMNKLFFGTSAEEAQALAANSADPNQDCPVTDIRAGASTLQVNTGTEKSANTVRYQATIARLARECAVRGPTMTVKV